MTRHQGSVLILVTWTVASLSLLAAVLGVRSLFALSFSQRMERQLQSRAIALAGIELALTELDRDSTPSEDGLGETWMDNPVVFQSFQVGRGEVSLSYGDRYGFTDEERKLPLNKAPPAALHNLFIQVPGVTVEEVNVIVDSILDWRDADKEKQPEGAENFYYLGQDPAYECKDAPFENVEELLFVQGVTPEILDWVSPHLTVYGSGKVNLNTADRETLKALGLSQEGVNGIVFYRAGEDNTEGTVDDRMLSAVSAATTELAAFCPVEDLNRLAQLDAQQLLAVGSKAFDLRVTAWVEGDAASEARVQAVMDRTGRILAWREL